VASLIQELINVLEGEADIYEQLIPIANEKTRIIIKNDLAALKDITAREQLMVDRINALEHKREQVILNIKTVLNIRPETLNLETLIKMLGKQPKEQKALSLLRDSLKENIDRLVEINDRNKILIEQSLEMIEFNMNVINGVRITMENSTYTKEASECQAQLPGAGMFDARQ
jgi:hypothetical protein